MKRLTKILLIIFIPILLIALFFIGFFTGKLHEIREYENEIDLTFEAAAQQYKTYNYDSSKFDYYGNPRPKADTLKRVLPQNSRTEYAKQTANRNKEQSQSTRKRD